MNICDPLWHILVLCALSEPLLSILVSVVNFLCWLAFIRTHSAGRRHRSNGGLLTSQYVTGFVYAPVKCQGVWRYKKKSLIFTFKRQIHKQKNGRGGLVCFLEIFPISPLNVEPLAAKCLPHCHVWISVQGTVVHPADLIQKKGCGSAHLVRALLWKDPARIQIGRAIIPNQLSSLIITT